MLIVTRGALNKAPSSGCRCASAASREIHNKSGPWKLTSLVRKRQHILPHNVFVVEVERQEANTDARFFIIIYIFNNNNNNNTNSNFDNSCTWRVASGPRQQ